MNLKEKILSFIKNKRKNNINIYIFYSKYNKNNKEFIEVYKDLKEIYKKEIFLKILEVTENKELIKRFNILNVPCFLITENNNLIYFQEKKIDIEDVILILRKKLPIIEKD